jgi:23S rRNA pseudouridine1911/1915/1917 synthase
MREPIRVGTGIRLDKLVAERFGLSRSAAQEAIRTGRVDVDGVCCDQSGLLIAPTREVTYHPHRPKARRVVGFGLQVLHEDDDVIVVNKPAGLLTLPTAAHEVDTLATRAERYLRIRHGRRPELGIIHRLDKETSGALAFAKNAQALRLFQALLRAHAIERRYLALVEGLVASARGRIDRSIVTHTGTVRRRLACLPDEGVTAVTNYEVLERFGRHATLLDCRLETGRTHQIRLHLASIGHPVVGDDRYRPQDQPKTKARFSRQALHARTLAFTHPVTGCRVHVEAPLPDDLAELLADLRSRFGVANPGG